MSYVKNKPYGYTLIIFVYYPYGKYIYNTC